MTKGVSTGQRLQEALSNLLDQHAAKSVPGKITATALCQLAGVSRTALYRYHPDILNELRKWQRKHRPEAASARKALKALRAENAALRTQLGQLAALVDHYFAAWSESQALLERREGELAVLRRSNNRTLVSVRPKSESGSSNQ
ncbi:MAG: hypothetical protein F4181_06005 [Proteobacteria bacterium]|nr:hypothetical protein [Pseudomonadota bacterium]